MPRTILQVPLNRSKSQKCDLVYRSVFMSLNHNYEFIYFAVMGTFLVTQEPLEPGKL